MIIVPAILTDNREEFIKFLSISETFSKQVQIDIMDGKFVPSQSIVKEDLRGLKSTCFTEAHLMVNNPLFWLDVFRTVHLDTGRVS